MRRGTRLDVIANIRYSVLEESIAWDVSVCVADVLRRHMHAKTQLHPLFISTTQTQRLLYRFDPEIALVVVAPKSLKACTRIITKQHEAITQEYERAWREGSEFPPIVIDSTSPTGLLCEGWHRACAAERAGISGIEAIDVGSIDPEPIAKYYESRIKER